MRSLGLATLCALALAAVAPDAVAQSALPDSGAHVRIRLRSDTGFAHEGDLLARPADSVIMRVPGGTTLRSARRDVQALQVATVARRTGAGIGIGLLTGAVLGAVIGPATSHNDDYFGPTGEAVLGATLYGLIGAVAGGIVGSSYRTTVWRDVPLETSLSRHGLSVGLSF